MRIEILALIVFSAITIAILSVNLWRANRGGGTVSGSITLKDALQWMRHEFGRWFAGTTVLMLAWVIAAWAIWVGIHWDMGFAETMAPDADDVAIYRQAGVVISLACVFLLSLSTWAFRMKAPIVGFALCLFWAAATVFSFSHGVGETTRKFDEQYRYVSAIEENADKPKAGRDETRRTLEALRSKLIADRDAEILPLDVRAKALEDDGVAGIGSKDLETIAGYQKQISAIQELYRPRIEKIDEKLFELSLAETSAEIDSQMVVTDLRQTEKFNPLFATLAGRDENGRVNEAAALAWQKWYSILWPMIVTALGTLPAVLLHLHWHAAKLRPEWRSESDVAAFDLDGEQYTEDEIRDALAKRERRTKAARQGVETKRIKAERERIAKILKADPDSDRVIDTQDKMDRVRALFKRNSEPGNPVLRPDEIGVLVGYDISHEFFAWVRRFFEKNEADMILNGGLTYETQTA